MDKHINKMQFGQIAVAKVGLKNLNIMVQVEQGLNFIGYHYKDRSCMKYHG